MNNIKKLADIQYLINETYSDKEPLTKEQKASKKVFNEYCEDIRKDLTKIDDIENQPCIEGYKERTSKNVLYGLHSLCLKGTNRAYWGMVRHMVEQIEKDLDVLGIIKNEVPFAIDYDGDICISYDPDDDDCNCVYLNIDEEMRDKLKEWMGW